MKILAQGKGDELILTATKDEVANLLGFYSSWRNCPELKVGTDIPVNAIYSSYREVANLGSQLEESIKIHKGLVDRLAKFNALVAPSAEVIRKHLKE